MPIVAGEKAHENPTVRHRGTRERGGDHRPREYRPRPTGTQWKGGEPPGGPAACALYSPTPPPTACVSPDGARPLSRRDVHARGPCALWQGGGMRARHAAAVVSDTGDACDRTALFKWPRGFVPTRGGAV